MLARLTTVARAMSLRGRRQDLNYEYDDQFSRLQPNPTSSVSQLTSVSGLLLFCSTLCYVLTQAKAEGPAEGRGWRRLQREVAGRRAESFFEVSLIGDARGRVQRGFPLLSVTNRYLLLLSLTVIHYCVTDCNNTIRFQTILGLICAVLLLISIICSCCNLPNNF